MFTRTLLPFVIWKLCTVLAWTGDVREYQAFWP